MGSVYLLVSLCLAFLGTSAHSMSAATTDATPSVAEMILEKIERLGDELNEKLDQKLSSVSRDTQSSCSPANAGGSGQETSATVLLLGSMQAKLAAMEKHQEAADATIRGLKTELETSNTALQSAQTLLHSRMTSGSTFVRWGRTSCTNNTQLVYTGVAGGSYYGHAGAAANMLCLTKNPQFDGAVPTSGRAFLYGSEYQEMPDHTDQDPPCSVCLAAQSSTIMVPGTLTCPSGWTVQYTGHLVAGHYTHAAASEYNCLDGHPEHRISGHPNHNGRLLYYTVTACGSLPCPPYVKDKVVTCAVCSK